MSCSNNWIRVMLLTITHIIDPSLFQQYIVELSCVIIRVVVTFTCSMSRLFATFTNLLNFRFILIIEFIFSFVIFDCMMHIEFTSRGLFVQFATTKVHFAWILRFVGSTRPIEIFVFNKILVTIFTCLS